MIIESAGVERASAWDDYVATHPNGSPYHTQRWLDLTQTEFGHRQISLVALSSKGEIRGVLPMTRLRSLMFGNFWVSLPFVNFGGPLADSSDIGLALMQRGAEIAAREGASHAEFRSLARYEDQWALRTDKVLMELELPKTEASFLQSIGAKLRSQAKRAVREGATIHYGGLDLVSEFYAVFSENYRDLGTPVYARKFFERITATFPSEVTISVVRIGAIPVAAGLTLRHGRRTEIPWASALRRYNKFSVNMFLYAEIIKREIAAGQTTFDFGRSSVNAGTFRFKKQWGALPRQLYWHYWLKSGEKPPALNPDNPKFSLAIQTWRKLPLPLTRLIGPHIVKYLP